MADAKQVESYKESVKKEAEKLVLEGFPKIIVELNDLLETTKFKSRSFSDVHQDLNISIPEPIVLNNSNNALPPTKKTKYDESISHEKTKENILVQGTVPLNQPLFDIFVEVKPRLRKLVEDANLLKMWISYMVPKIEDGNNFGVSILEDTLGEIQSVESEAATFLSQISRYYVTRGKLISKVVKYPHIDDYRRAVQELDEKEYISMWLILSEVRNRYCLLHDIVLKNLEKIKKPRSTNVTESLY